MTAVLSPFYRQGFYEHVTWLVQYAVSLTHNVTNSQVCYICCMQSCVGQSLPAVMSSPAFLHLLLLLQDASA